MRILKRHISFLQLLYIIICVLLSLVMIFTPIILTRSVHIRRMFIIDEDVLEVCLLGFLFALTLLIFRLYQQEASKQEELINNIKEDKRKADEKLLDSLDYIGKVNVQIEEIKSIYDASNTYPSTKSDFKRIARLLGERILGIVNTKWMLLRIISSGTYRTIYECFETRNDMPSCYPHVSNKMIIEQQSAAQFTTVILKPHNLNFLVFCAMPVDAISDDQRVFIRAIMNEVSLLFIISHSSFKDDRHVVFLENRITKKIEAVRPMPPS